MKRWTIKDLNEVNNIRFATLMLCERKSNLNYYSPLSIKLNEVISLLQQLEETKDETIIIEIVSKLKSK